MAVKKRVGLLGGSFDPIHNAHLSLAECAYKELLLDELWFLPAGQPYMDKHGNVSSPERRLEMTRAAIRGRENFRVSAVELEREGNTYTVDTLRLLKKAYPDTEFCYIIGADQLYALDRWHEPEELFSLCRFAAAGRITERQERGMEEQAAYLSEKYGADISLLNFEISDVSSTMVRGLIAGGQDVSGLVPAPVISLIRKWGLYGAASPDEGLCTE